MNSVSILGVINKVGPERLAPLPSLRISRPFRFFIPFLFLSFPRRSSLSFFRAARLWPVPSINEHLLVPLNNKQEQEREERRMRGRKEEDEVGGRELADPVGALFVVSFDFSTLFPLSADP